MTRLLVTVPAAPREVGRAFLVEESAGRPQAVAADDQLVMRRRHPMLADVDVATRVDVHMPWKVLRDAAALARRSARAFWYPRACLSMAALQKSPGLQAIDRRVDFSPPPTRLAT